MRAPVISGPITQRSGGVDKGLLGAFIVLGLLGVAIIYSASRDALLRAGNNPHYYAERQAVWVIIGIVVMLAISRIDYRRLEIATTIFYLGSIMALLGVFVIGSHVQGATRWFSFGPIQIQPSEFALLAVILAMATYCGRRPDGLRMYDVSRMLVMAGIPLALIVLQPDLGTAMIMMLTIGAIFVVAGVPTRFMALLGIGAIVGATASVYFGLLHRYQILRLVSFWNQNSSNTLYAQEIYQTSNTKTSIGAGGLLGVGAFHGHQTVGGFVPAQITDNIFAAVGEQFGLVGTVAIIVLLTFVGLRLYVIARDAKEPMGRLLVVGIFIIFAFSCFENIGMTTGIMPVTGIPLPLISYGGSSVLVFYICAGVALSVSRRRTN
jgi:rod shape determining protein RodA